MFQALKLTIVAALVAMVAVGGGIGGEKTSASSAINHAGPAPVRLGLAGKFVILSKSGITNVPTSAITGDIGTSPITGAAITGLGCAQVTGTIYTVNAAGPPCRVIRPQRLTTAVHDMVAAYKDAAGRKNPKATELGAGQIGGRTIRPGLYKWSSGVLITTDVTLRGGPNAVWIFQIAGTLREASGMKVILRGGARARNIFWQVAGVVTIGTTAHFRGIVLAKRNISPKTGAVITGRLLAQTAVTLKMNRVTQPGAPTGTLTPPSMQAGSRGPAAV
jgi:hypothetical protein